MLRLESYFFASQPNKGGQYVSEIIRQSYQINYFEGVCDGLCTRLNLYITQEKTVEATAIAFEIDSLGKQHNLPIQQAKAALMLGQLYGQVLNNPDKALPYYLKAERILNAYNGPVTFDVTGNRIKAYHDLGNLFEAKKKYSTAITYYRQALKLVQQHRPKHSMSNLQESAILLNMGNIYKDQKYYKLAQVYYKNSLVIATKYDIMFLLPHIYTTQISLFLEQNKLSEAEKTIVLFENKFGWNSIDALQKQNLLNYKYQLYSKQRNFKKAFTYLEKYSTLRDSLLNQSVVDQVAGLETKYKMAQKEAHIAQLNASIAEDQYKKLIYSIFSGLLVILLILSGFFYEKLRRANQRKKQAIEQKDRLFSYISHDLRSPILSMQATIQHLTTAFQAKDSHQVLQWNQLLQKSISGLYLLVENLLQWAQAEHTKLYYRPQNIIIEHEILLIIDMYESTAKLKEIAIEFDYDEETCVWVDRASLHTILRNILSNALKFTNKHGIILIGVYKSIKSVSIFIQDNGVGIPSKNLPTIFMDNADKSQNGTDGEEGHGLGLYLCKQLTQLNHGNITIESDPNQGTVVFIELPASAEDIGSEGKVNSLSSLM